MLQNIVKLSYMDQLKVSWCRQRQTPQLFRQRAGVNTNVTQNVCFKLKFGKSVCKDLFVFFLSFYLSCNIMLQDVVLYQLANVQCLTSCSSVLFTLARCCFMLGRATTFSLRQLPMVSSVGADDRPGITPYSKCVGRRPKQ